MDLNDQRRKKLNGNGSNSAFPFYHRVSPYDPNLNLSSAAPYSPPYTNDQQPDVGSSYGNVIYVSNQPRQDENIIEQTTMATDSNSNPSYVLAASNSRLINNFLRDNSETSAINFEDPVQQSIGSFQILPSSGNIPPNVPVGTQNSNSSTQIIFHRSSIGHFYQQIHNVVLNENETAPPIELISTSHQDIVSDGLENFVQQFQQFNGQTTANGCLLDQPEEMIVIPNNSTSVNERIDLIINNGIQSFDYKFEDQQTNLLITDPNEVKFTIPESDESIEKTSRDSSHCERTHFDDRDAERLLLERTMSPLLAAVNDITQRDQENARNYYSPEMCTDLMDGRIIKTEEALKIYDVPADIQSHVPLLPEDTDDAINSSSSWSSSADTQSLAVSDNLKLINIRSVSDEFIDINDVRGVEFYSFQEEAMHSEYGQPLRRSKRKETCLMVADKHVPCRAWASLPTAYLHIGRLPENGAEYTVFSKKEIPLRTKFGPVEGDLKRIAGNLSSYNEKKTREHPLLFVNQTQFLETSNENTSNWMRFVRLATNFKEQNLLLNECDGKLYFKCCQLIRPKEELRVGYSREYAEQYGLNYIWPRENNQANANDNTWPCFECDETFCSSAALQKHLEEHEAKTEPKVKETRKKRFVNRKTSRMQKIHCNLCSKSFLTALSLKRHMKFHNNFPLSDANKLTKKSLKIDRSIKRKSIGNHKLTNRENKGENPFKCDSCSKRFATKERLTRHGLVHCSNDAKPLECPHCPKRFVTSSAQAGHIKTHLYNYRLLQCPMCPERCRFVPDFKLHVKTHIGSNGMYTCHHCNKQFKEYVIIRKHIRAFHPEVKHPCGQCGKIFATMNKLRIHLLRHSDHREFLCSECGKQFKRKDKLRDHIKKIHTTLKVSVKTEKTGDELSEKKQAARGMTNELSKSLRKGKFLPKVSPNDYERFIYKCHECLLGFKRRGMLVNHLAKRHPNVSIESVPELNLPILKAQRYYYCQYCDKVYKSNSKRKAHILKYHPGLELPMSSRHKGGVPEIPGFPNPTFSETVGSVTTHPQGCAWCHKQYASKAKLLQHQRKKHSEHSAEIELLSNGGNVSEVCVQNSEQEDQLDGNFESYHHPNDLPYGDCSPIECDEHEHLPSAKIAINLKVVNTQGGTDRFPMFDDIEYTPSSWSSNCNTVNDVNCNSSLPASTAFNHHSSDG